MNKGSDNFEDELLKIQEILHHFAYRLTGNYDKANDLMQDTILKALVNRDKYVADNNFKGWVVTIMRNIFYNNYNKDSRITLFDEQNNETYSINIPNESRLGIEDGNYTLKEINQTIASVPLGYSIPLAMYLTGYRYDEIATFMHIPLGTVKSRIYYTRKKLQILLKDYRDDY